ncbi:MAG: efflux RND transporter periplasmic adaptor subunit [Alphaproteobacteria bacterium]|jgi:membrane fusion protein, multidrug efflux system|nr:efflux RND transporter periplasmic adaptor subunit [Alphaproteobacteria bacterium]MBT7943289.1 efflux RND transporter periplasmic adaptor subunit [Alphaproteobacteria bacterium]
MNRSYVIALSIAGVVAMWLGSGLLVGESGVEAAKSKAPSGEAALMQVRTRNLTAQDKASELIVFGRTEAVRTVTLRAETPGRVVAIPAFEGHSAKKGTILVRLASEDRPARLKESEAVVDHARLAFEAAQKLSKKAFRSKVQLAENKAQLASARARRAAIATEIRNTEIRAPFDGVINDLKVDIGDYLKVGDPVATVIDLDPMLIIAEIAERNIARITLGSAAKIRIVGLGAFNGVVKFISRTATPETRTFRIKIAVANPDAVIAEGMTSQVRLGGEVVRAHLLSPAVLTLSDDGVVGVKTVNGDDVVEFHPVRLIADTPEGMWVDGLGEKIRAVTVGQEFVRAGQKVQPVPEKTGAK